MNKLIYLMIIFAFMLTACEKPFIPATSAKPDTTQNEPTNPHEPADPADPEDATNDDDKNPPLPGDILYIADGDDYLALVTKKTSLGTYAPEDLVAVPEKMKLQSGTYQLREEAFRYFEEMWKAAQAEGIGFAVVSAYRSYSTQEKLFNRYAAKHGEEKANQFSARPGQSEHQLGTTVDLAVSGHVLTASFGGTYAGRWLAEHSYKYGFVISYPENTTDITGYIYEPWHFRFIGVDNASAWKESEQVLCTFLEQQPQQWKE